MKSQLLSLFLAGAVCGCTAQAILPDNVRAEAAPDIRAIISKNIIAKPHNELDEKSMTTTGNFYVERGAIFPATAKLDHVELSDMLRKVQTYFGWAWQTCIRLNVSDRPVTYAVFIAGDHVVDARASVAIDNCEQGNYTLLEVNEPHTKSKAGATTKRSKRR